MKKPSTCFKVLSDGVTAIIEYIEDKPVGTCINPLLTCEKCKVEDCPVRV